MPIFAGYSSGSAAEGDTSPTPYIGTESTSAEMSLLQATATQAGEQSLRYLRERDQVGKVLSAVDIARQQGADWDDEEGKPVPFTAAKRAKELLIDAASRAESAGRVWASPTVSATPNGGVHLSWFVAGNRVTLTIFAPHESTICVSKFRGGASQRELLSDFGAVKRVLQVFEASAPLHSVGSRR